MDINTKIKIKSKANALQFRKSVVVLGSMVKKNIKNQYRRSVLGIFWTVLNPLLNMLVMWFVFDKIFGRSSSELFYPVYILSGTITFNFMRSATVSSLPCMVNNYDLLTKTRVPYSVFPLSQNMSSVVNLGFSVIALIILMLACIPQGVKFYPTMLMLVVPWLPSIFLFSLGLSLALCSIYVRFRDIKHFYEVFLTLWMYATPIFYTLDSLKLGSTAGKILRLNPMYYYVGYVRDLLMGIVPSWQTHLICYGVGIAVFIIGAIIFRLSRKKFILYI
ncbi:MAG: ABC transporter permease [Bacteroides sp.]|nr:ABC transporter permease [Bacillota bacterium]MCM1393623.1 ABC transporter permease [[Eubacterium] siraeum]MCM1454969.1 ABC transporter permease [Bacteroides sp.]